MITAEIESITFRSKKCDMCDEPWTFHVEVEREDKEPLELCVCEEHYEKVKEKWNAKVTIIRRREE